MRPFVERTSEKCCPSTPRSLSLTWPPQRQSRAISQPTSRLCFLRSLTTLHHRQVYSIANCTAVVVDLALVFSVIVFSDEQCIQFSGFPHCKHIAPPVLAARCCTLHVLHAGKACTTDRCSQLLAARLLQLPPWCIGSRSFSH